MQNFTANYQHAVFAIVGKNVFLNRSTPNFFFHLKMSKEKIRMCQFEKYKKK